MSVTGDGAAPVPAGAAVADHVGALTLALGIVTALFARERTGKGQQVECSLLGSLIAAQSWELTHYMMTREMPDKAGRGHTHLPWLWYTYRTADGWLAIGGVDPSRLPGFWRAIGLTEMGNDERFNSIGKLIRSRDKLNELLDKHFSTRKTADWLPALEEADIFCAPVLDYEQVTNADQSRANGHFTTLDHPRIGQTSVVPCPISFSKTPVSVGEPDPTLGEHTDEVLRRFGYAKEQVADLKQQAVV